ncbi:hypothetical protein [Actinobaculum sp. 352]|uniref:hypothetical protein n=1 Tax=Actinobaculum sp. 352 TaxID=2490946 RepID=UPI000F7F8252|nr:hypothetical protein [Actinobaculum sp. 352]RTE47925.1 hypothetical protein EKN07_11745 [Actinobaculum sp. 352]
MGTKAEIGTLNRSVVDIFLREMNRQGLSFRALAERSGVPLTRLHAKMRCERALLVEEINSIADALGLVGWQVMREAETAVAAKRSDSVSDPIPTIDPEAMGLAATRRDETNYD